MYAYPYCTCTKVLAIYSEVFDVGPNFKYPPSLGSYFSVTKSSVQVGLHVSVSNVDYICILINYF